MWRSLTSIHPPSLSSFRLTTIGQAAHHRVPFTPCVCQLRHIIVADGATHSSTAASSSRRLTTGPNRLMSETDPDAARAAAIHAKRMAAFQAQQARHARKKLEWQQAAAEAAGDQHHQQQQPPKVEPEQNKREEATQPHQQKQQQQNNTNQQQHQHQEESSAGGPSILEQLRQHYSSQSGRRSNGDANHQTGSTSSDHSDQPMPEDLASTPPTSSSSSSSLPDLKYQLRRFFLQVHPDFFESSPKEKESNAKNLAVLSDFLDVLRGEGTPNQNGKGKTAKVQFWVRTKEKELKPGEQPSTPTTPAPSTPGQPTFYKISSTLHLHSTGGSNARSHANLYTSLSSLFKQAGLLHANNWHWGEEYEVHAQSSSTAGNSNATSSKPSSSPNGAYDDDYFNRHASASFNSSAEGRFMGAGAITGEFEEFIRRVRGLAHHYEEVAKTKKHDYLLTMAHLRMQGMKILFEGDEFSIPGQKLVIDAFERVLLTSRHFKPPEPMYRPGPKKESEWSKRAPASPSYSFYRPPDEPAQPTQPWSQTVKMPEEVEYLVAQMKKHRRKEEQQGSAAPSDAPGASSSSNSPSTTSGTTAPSASGVEPHSKPASTATNDFEARRSPFSRVTSVFSSTATRSHIDGRGRLVFSLHETESDWSRFINSSDQLIVRALALQQHYRALKGWEKQVAEDCGVYDIFCESSLIDDEQLQPPTSASSINGGGSNRAISPEYIQFLTRLQQDAHLLRSSLHQLFPDYNEISFRISRSPTGESASTTPARECFSVDPTLGLLMIPLHATVEDIRLTVLERGQECIQIKRRHLEDVSSHAASLLHTKRHLKLRSLTSSPNITRDQMLSASERLSRVFGSLRDLLQGTNLEVGDVYECSEESGVIKLKWDWS